MKRVAVQYTEDGFSDRWINYCKKHAIPYQFIDCYGSDVMRQVDTCSTVVWHHHHNDSKDTLFAKELLYAMQRAGKVVFPDFKSGWHFNDKLGQKYLLEALDLPLIPTYVFYHKQAAMAWAQSTIYPKVFKLRNGAGSMNVRLVNTPKEAAKRIRRAFAKGHAPYSQLAVLKDKFRLYRQHKIPFLKVTKAFAKWLMPWRYARLGARERGYVYFQDFIPHNSFDIRVVVIANKAIAIKRYVRRGDFRASGSGIISYLDQNAPLCAVRMAFQASRKIQSQCIALDFIFQNDKPFIAEISYGFSVGLYDGCPGYWDEHLNWHAGSVNLCAFMMEILLEDEKA